MTAPKPETIKREKDKLYVTDAELIRRLGVPAQSARMTIQHLEAIGIDNIGVWSPSRRGMGEMGYVGNMAKMTIERIGLDEANAFVTAHHRHHKPVVGHLFSIGAAMDGKIVGVVIIGRPVARMRDDGTTAEVTRLCTDGTRNACSFLYDAAARAAFALGFKRIGTYILASEPGTSLTAAGWRMIGQAGGGSWSRKDRPRVDKAPTQVKMLFETSL